VHSTALLQIALWTADRARTFGVQPLLQIPFLDARGAFLGTCLGGVHFGRTWFLEAEHSRDNFDSLGMLAPHRTHCGCIPSKQATSKIFFTCDQTGTARPSLVAESECVKSFLVSSKPSCIQTFHHP
jgi:hypothetical protein